MPGFCLSGGSQQGGAEGQGASRPFHGAQPGPGRPWEGGNPGPSQPFLGNCLAKCTWSKAGIFRWVGVGVGRKELAGKRVIGLQNEEAPEQPSTSLVAKLGPGASTASWRHPESSCHAHSPTRKQRPERQSHSPESSTSQRGP